MTDENLDLLSYMSEIGARAAKARDVIRLASAKQRRNAINAMAHEIHAHRDNILNANQRDMDAAAAKGLSAAMLDRLKLDETRHKAITDSLDAIADLPDPIGKIDESWTQPNGLMFEKRRIPIGVIGMIYESRPNVTADAGALCLKSGNACILRAGSESQNSSGAIHAALSRGLEQAGLPKDSVQLINTTDRAAVGLLLGGLDQTVDLIIPRGGKNLIARVKNDARVPVLAHLEGLCHSYIHAEADLEMAREVLLNAKLRRTGVCGSTETLLIDSEIAPKALPDLAQSLIDAGCELRGDALACKAHSGIKPASDGDYFTEHLAAILNIKTVSGIEAALDHIEHYGSGHTDAIITEKAEIAERFLRDVDSAIVMHNSSTQFADGGEFGFGAEIGIATGRLHARGPVGAQHLTTYKYTVRGKGHTRP